MAIIDNCELVWLHRWTDQESKTASWLESLGKFVFHNNHNAYISCQMFIKKQTVVKNITIFVAANAKGETERRKRQLISVVAPK